MTFERIEPVPPWVEKLLDQVRETEQSNGTFEVEADDEIPYSQLGSWVALSRISPNAMALYWFLAMHLNLTRGDRYVWPSKDALAYLMGYSRGDKIDPFMKELVAIGAVVVTQVPDGNGPQRRNVYRLRRNPPAGYDRGPVTLKAFYEGLGPELEQRRSATSASRSAKSKKTAGQDVIPGSGVQSADGSQSQPSDTNSSKTAGQPVSPETGVHVHPETREDVYPEMRGHVYPETGCVTRTTTNKKNVAPSGRVSAPDARRATTGSSARATRGGSAASGKASSSTPKKNGQRRLSQQQAEAVRVVESGFPEALQGLLPNYRPPVLRDAILEALKDRTAGQLAQRVSRRWLTHGYAEALFGGKGIASPVGVAVALVRAPVDCPDLSCEDGVIMGSGEPCGACQMRKADRRAPKSVAQPEPAVEASASIPGQGTPPPAKWWCVTGCGFSSYAVPPQDQMCRDCRADAQAEAALSDPVELELVRQAVEAALVGGEAEQ